MMTMNVGHLLAKRLSEERLNLAAAGKGHLSTTKAPPDGEGNHAFVLSSNPKIRPQ